MNSPLKNIVLPALLSVAGLLNGQQEPVYYDLRKNAIFDSIKMDDLNSSVIHYSQIPDTSSGNSLNYVKTLLYAYKKFATRDKEGDGGILSQAFAYVGDDAHAILLESKLMPPYEQLNDTAYTNRFASLKIDFLDPKTYIIERFKKEQIIMFNEAHDRPQTRAFVLSLLADLKKAGATCLAMETLSDKGNRSQLDVTTGIYTAEPVMGQLVREALRLGFKLIPYEEIVYYNDMAELEKYSSDRRFNRRDSVQAVNLYQRIKTKNGIEKTVVLAGYAHIYEQYSRIKTMAMNFKKISGIDPFTVSQIELMEAYSSAPYAKRLLDKLYAMDSTKLLVAGPGTERLKLLFEVDAYIYHKNVSYIHHRPDYLLSEGKTFYEVEIPANIKPVLIQCYLAGEIKSEKDYNFKIPFDQTFSSENKKAWCVLQKRNVYWVVFRDEKNRIVHKTKLKT